MEKLAVLEGILFLVGEEGISMKKIMEILDVKRDVLVNMLQELQNEYSDDKRGIRLDALGNNIKLTTKKEHASYYKKLVETSENTLSQAALETLAIIAYKQPITRIEVDEIRGISSVHMIRKLISMNLVTEAGKSDIPGKPNLYKVTNQFLDYFGLTCIEDLPQIETKEQDDIEKDLFESKYIEDNDN